jgi:hypothetical protein
LGSTCVDISHQSGRTEQNANDVEYALQLHENMNIKDLYQYYLSLAIEEDADPDRAIPNPVNLSTFEFDVPNFPRPKSSNLNLASSGDQTIANRFARIDSTEQPAAVLAKQKQEELEAFKPPAFLPPFPPQHTFSFTPVLSDRPKDAYTIQQLKTKQRRQIESSLTRIHNAELMDKIPEGMAFEEEWEFYHEQQQAQANMTVVDHNTPDQVIKGANSNIDEDLVVNPYLVVMRKKSSAIAPRQVQQQQIVPSSEAQPQENGEPAAAPAEVPQLLTTLSLKRPFVSGGSDIGSNYVKGDKEVITGVTGQDLDDILGRLGASPGEPSRKKQKKTHPNAANNVLQSKPL